MAIRYSHAVLTCRASVASTVGALMSTDGKSHPGESVDDVETIANVSTVLNCFVASRLFLNPLARTPRSDNRRLPERAAFRMEAAGAKYRHQMTFVHQRSTAARSSRGVPRRFLVEDVDVPRLTSTISSSLRVLFGDTVTSRDGVSGVGPAVAAGSPPRATKNADHTHHRYGFLTTRHCKVSAFEPEEWNGPTASWYVFVLRRHRAGCHRPEHVSVRARRAR